MKNKIFLVSIIPLIFLTIMGACKPAPPVETNPANQQTATTSPTITSPEPVVDYKKLTEEELASLIHETIAEVESAANASSIALQEVGSGNVLTDEEAAETMANLLALQSAIVFTQELIGVYANLYIELAHETINSLIVIDEDLDKIATNANEVVLFLEQGQDFTSTEMDQLNAANIAIETQSTKINMQSTVWLSNVQTQIEDRERLYANTPPQLSKVAYNRIDAFTQAHDFLDAFTTALNDEKFSPAELAEISQLAATAKASLYNTGDPQLITFARQINDLTHNASRGEWAIASSRLYELKFSLPAKPRP